MELTFEISERENFRLKNWSFLFLKSTVVSEIFHGIRYRESQQLNSKPELPVQNASWHYLFWNKHKNLDIFMVHDNDLLHFLLKFLPNC